MKDLTPEQIKAKLIADHERLKAMEAELFTMANSYSGDRYGYIAQGLHEVCNNFTHPLHFIPIAMSQLIVDNIIAKVDADAKVSEAEAYAELKKALDIQHANYEEYSYYVGGEITCDRMPMKFSPWMDSRKPDKVQITATITNHNPRIDKA